MQIALILALVAAAAAAPTGFVAYSEANNVIEPQFPRGFVASGIIPTTYAAGIGAGNFEGQNYFGGRPGTYVRQDNIAAAPAAIPAFSTYSAFPQTYSGFQQGYPMFTQGFSGVPAATYYSATPGAVAFNPAAFPKSVQQNEGARLIAF